MSIRPCDSIWGSSDDKCNRTINNETPLELIGHAMTIIAEPEQDNGDPDEVPSTNQTYPEISMSGDNFIVGVILAGKDGGVMIICSEW